MIIPNAQIILFGQPPVRLWNAGVAGGAYANALTLDTFGSIEDWVTAIDENAEANSDAPLLFGCRFLASTFGPIGPTQALTSIRRHAFTLWLLL